MSPSLYRMIKRSKNTGPRPATTDSWRSDPLIAHLGQVYLLADRPGDAIAFAEGTLTPSQRDGERRMEAFTLAPRRNRVDANLCLLRSPKCTIGRRRPWLKRSACAHSLPTVTSGSGSLYRRAGKREQARTHLATGTAMYQEMGMQFWFEKAEAEMSWHHPSKRCQTGSPDLRA
jgi:hypothetical protein